MRKSTTKVFKEKVRNYIKECVYDECDGRGCTLQALLDEYNEQPEYAKVCHSIAEFLTDYMLVFEMWTINKRSLLQDWFDETDEEASRYTDTEVERFFKAYIDREICDALNLKSKIVNWNGACFKEYTVNQ